MGTHYSHHSPTVESTETQPSPLIDVAFKRWPALFIVHRSIARRSSRRAGPHGRRERALNAEDALKNARAEILAQRAWIG